MANSKNSLYYYHQEREANGVLRGIGRGGLGGETKRLAPAE